MALIELEHVCKTFSTTEAPVFAVCDVSFNISEGEFVALVGPSGSGKSTLMNMLSCLDRPTSGLYRLAGREVQSLSAAERAKVRNERIGFVFQCFNLLNRTSACENVQVPMLYNASIPRTQRRTVAEKLLQRVGLGERLSHHPSQLSGGQQQRVAIARALANRPSLLLCDEPTGALDVRTGREILALFRELNRHEGLTVLLVTHDPHVAQQADRVIVLVDGRIHSDTHDFSEAETVLNAVREV